jgi:hypothetical protein
MHGMTAPLAASAPPPASTAAIVQVRSASDLDAWHEVYCEVFGVDLPMGRRAYAAAGYEEVCRLPVLVAR